MLPAVHLKITRPPVSGRNFFSLDTAAVFLNAIITQTAGGYIPFYLPYRNLRKPIRSVKIHKVRLAQNEKMCRMHRYLKAEREEMV